MAYVYVESKSGENAIVNRFSRVGDWRSRCSVCPYPTSLHMALA